MNQKQVEKKILDFITQNHLSEKEDEQPFYARLLQHSPDLCELYLLVYNDHPNAAVAFVQLLDCILQAHQNRSTALRKRDEEKKSDWFLSNQMAGMSLYVDRFCGNLDRLTKKLNYFEQLGVNLLHLMPIFQSPEKESDGGYAVSDFRAVDERLGTIADIQNLQSQMQEKEMYLMLDIVLNHTSNQHAWALKARKGIKKYQDFYYFFDDRKIPDSYDRSMPEIFPESAPGNFSFIEELNKWVMTVFHHYQWDLNYRSPAVFAAMLDIIFFYANLGVDILRIDAPAFIWKQEGTSSQNLPQAHSLLQLVKKCVQIATPGMAILGEAIVAPAEIQNYFGTGKWQAQECDFAYNATHMALQWDALATTDTRVMYAAQHEILKKPFGCSWITYTRCHDDIGLGYDDYMIGQAGFNPVEHRRFLKAYYSGEYAASPARGDLFSVNEKTGDARISGTLASLCGLEKALAEKNEGEIAMSIQKILMMQAQSFFLGGTPMIFYGDEQGYTNDYSYLQDAGKHYDNRWMHRPLINWDKNTRSALELRTEQDIFSGTKKLLSIRKSLDVLADRKNLTWLSPPNRHIAAFLRAWESARVYCIFNFNTGKVSVPWRIFQENGIVHHRFFDHWTEKWLDAGAAHEQFFMEPYQFLILEPGNDKA